MLQTHLSTQEPRKNHIRTTTNILEVLKSLLQTLTPLFTHKDTHEILSKKVIPVKFHEANPEYIVVAYERYIEKNPDAKTVSVASKLEKFDYHTPYDLFHDLKLACGVEIVKYPVGLETYKNIDSYFYFTTELLLKEVERVGHAVFQEKEREDEEDMMDGYRDEFDRISKNLLQSNQEVITYLHKYEEPSMSQYNGLHGQSPPPPKVITQPLFSGLTGRSILDTRNTTVPDPFQLAKVIGSATTADSAVMKSFNFSATRIPAPSSNAQVLESFFHPNWYTVEASKWLTYTQKSLTPPVASKLFANPESLELRTVEKKSNVVSFAPTCDLRNAAMSKDLKLSVWFNDIGYSLIKGLEGESQSGQLEHALESATASKISERAEEPKEEEKKDDIIQNELPSEAKSKEVKLENLARFMPETFATLKELKEETSQIKSAADLQKVISSNLLKLQTLRQKRFLQSTSPSAPTPLEVACYKKIMKYFALLVDLNAARGKKIDLPISKQLPVLLNDYPGVLPGSVSAKVSTSSKTGRLASIRASYKKKGRFL